ncbi:predicted protein [Postia placenta Mad-698-R]|nr:predicted protein [Postia placenta Mad-698-R]
MSRDKTRWDSVTTSVTPRPTTPVECRPHPMAEAATVEASRAKRIERLKSRYRDRGGIFVPATHNPLLDILLSRGVDGESPSKARRRASRRSFVAIRESPTPGHRTGPDVDEDVVGDVPARSAKPKGKGRKSAGTTAQARRKSTAKERKESVAVPEAEPSAGPSHTSPLEPDTKQQEVAEDARLKNGAVSAKPSTRRPAVKGTRAKKQAPPSNEKTDDEPEQRKPSSAPPKKRKLPVIPEKNEESEREGSHPVRAKKRRPSTSGSAIMPNSGRTGRPAQDDDPEPRENASGGSASGSANREKGGRVITTDAETLSTNKVVKQANTRRSKPKPRAPSPNEDAASSSDVPLCTIRQLAEAKTHKPSRTQADPEPRKRTKMKQNEVPEGVLADVVVQPPGSRKRKTAEGEDASRAKKPKKDTGKPKPEDAHKSKVRPADKENYVASSNKLTKGTPRLSMFPTPSNVANDDDDPIDFLS